MATECHFFTDKMIVQFNITGARMMDRVGNEIGGINVVTVEQGRKRYGAAKFMEEEANLYSFCTSVSQ